MPPRKFVSKKGHPKKINLIAVTGIHATNSLQTVLKVMMHPVNGYFEALGFFDVTFQTKSAYLRLSPHLDANTVVSRINKLTKYGAYVLDSLPKDLVLNKKGKIPLPLRLANRVSGNSLPSQLVYATTREIILEMQAKYAGLFNSYRKYGTDLIGELTSIVYDRMQAVYDKQPESYETGFQLSKSYRRAHPHFGDFQLILSSLHTLQDAAGQPRAQLSEHELSTIQVPTYGIDNIPFEKIQQACNKYSEKIIKKLSDHISSLSAEVKENETEDEVSRRRVREELKKISPYLPVMVKQVITSHFRPQKAKVHRVTIYGEPFMPTKEVMHPFVSRYRPMHIARSDRIYNQLLVTVPAAQYTALIAMDGTVVGGVKLVIRPSDLPKLTLSRKMVQEMRRRAGLNSIECDEEIQEDEAMEE